MQALRFFTGIAVPIALMIGFAAGLAFLASMFSRNMKP